MSTDVAPERRGLITGTVMLTTIMQALDTTIANVALPHMQGTLSATQDQVSWILTSYIIGAAIFMPMTGFVASRIGRKRLFTTSVIGFTVTSVLCGAAQTLDQMVLFRLLQGIFGAGLVPLSQAVLLDSHPREKHGSAMALWGVGVMVGPILGPTLGGYLTEYYNWRWVFYINLPFGILAWLGLTLFVDETPVDRRRRFDMLGFAFLAIMLGTVQLALDRGELLGWLDSGEIQLELGLALLCGYLFIVHSCTHAHPFISPSLFRDRNFSVGLMMIFVVGIILLATMALLPPYLQHLANYPVVTTGLVLAPRGVGTMIAMLIAGRLNQRVDDRHKIGVGLLLTTISLWEMTHFTPDLSQWDLVRTGVVQGLGLGLIFVPLSTLTFATLPTEHRNEGTALFSLMRNIGSSIGISWMMTLLSQNTQANHNAFAGYITDFSIPLKQAVDAGVWNLNTPQGITSLNAAVTRQAQSLAYLQDFHVMMWVTLISLAMLPLLQSQRKRARAGA